jgi:hypothetical protein
VLEQRYVFHVGVDTTAEVRVRSSVLHVVLVLQAAEVLSQATACLLLCYCSQPGPTTMQPLFDYNFSKTVLSNCVCLLCAGRLHCCCML